MAVKNKKKSSVVKPLPSPIQITTYDRDDLEFIINNPHECTACGRRFSKQEGNFIESPSFLYAANRGYTNICCDCAITILEHYTVISGDYIEGIKRLCSRLDIYFDRDLSKEIYEPSISADILISKYMSLVDVNKTFDNSYFDDPGSFMNLSENQDLNLAIIERWGSGVYDKEEYMLLEEHYHMLKNQNPNCDSNQEIFIKDLCEIKLQQRTAKKSRNADDIKKLMDLYRATFKEAGLQAKIETDDGTKETLGMTLATLAQYTPEEYYKDKKLYKDFDGIGEYFERFVLRPLRNIILGSKDNDPEYSIKNEDVKNE